MLLRGNPYGVKNNLKGDLLLKGSPYGVTILDGKKCWEGYEWEVGGIGEVYERGGGGFYGWVGWGGGEGCERDMGGVWEG